MRLQYDFFLSLRNLVVCMKTKHFVCVRNFYNVSMKTGYFNTNFVFLQYKNTNHKINIREKTANLSSFFFLGWVQLDPCRWVGQTRASMRFLTCACSATVKLNYNHLNSKEQQLLFKWVIIQFNSKTQIKNCMHRNYVIKMHSERNV